MPTPTELQKELEALARFPDMNPGPVIRLDSNGKIILANKGARKIFSHDSLIGMSWPELCPDLDGEAWQKVLENQSYGHEADVNERCYLFTHVQSDDKENYFVFGSDVSQIKIIERELEEQKESLAQMARFPDMNPGPVLRLTRKGEIVLANKAARKIFEEESLIGKNWVELCPDLNEELWSDISTCSSNRGHEADVGERCYLFIHVCPPEGEFFFVFGSDVTEIKLIERQLESQKAELANMARFPDMNPGPVLRIDPDGEVLLTNAAAKELFGADIAGENWIEKCPGVNSEFWKRVQEAPDIPIQLEEKVGSKVFVFTHRKDGNSDFTFVFGADITKQKVAEKSLQQSEKMATLGTLAAGVAHELNNPAAATKRSSESLRDQLNELEQLHLELTTLDLSKDERNVLSELDRKAHQNSMSFSSMSALERSSKEDEIEDWLDEKEIEEPWELAPNLLSLELDSDDLDAIAEKLEDKHLEIVLKWVSALAPVYALIGEISEGSSRISEIVIALKNYSFVGQAPVQEVDIHQGLDNTLVILRSKIKGGIELERDYCDSLPLIMGYGSELNQVWTNLIDNAVDALGEKGKVIIRTKTFDHKIIVEIEDDGKGISPEHIGQVFDPFFTTKSVGKGTGLGLSTSYGIIVEKHHGKMTVESQPGRTIFRIELPLRH